ncbi:MAG: hypothetical protein U9N55_06495 [candidate division Zixibacteria bacterium]|nr:hypothetical protein [candidate division Zixibacteria bacterium]
MSIILGIVILFIALILGILLMQLHFRIKWSSERKWIFVGLGRSGSEFDMVERIGTLKLFGITLKHFQLERVSEDETRVEKHKPKKLQKKRRRSWKQLQQLLPILTKEFLSFSKRILSVLVIEELRGEIRAGFDSPSDTGVAFGYYQAALAVAPGVVGRLQFVPVWEGPSLSASARAAIALPFYKLLWRTVVLAWRLPLRDIYKLAIGTKKGEHDVQ